jgi:hypothetical protein
VVGNPFLRPGSNRPIPTPIPDPPPPKPRIDPAFAKEVEFRGYFLLKGIPHFCIFNKKSNFGEWIKLTEKTFEDYEVQAFDIESETLTLVFNGQGFTLDLYQSKGSTIPSNKGSGLPRVKLPPTASTIKGSPRKVMPPKPKSTPVFPDWLSNRISSRTRLSPPSPGATLRGLPQGLAPPPRGVVTSRSNPANLYNPVDVSSGSSSTSKNSSASSVQQSNDEMISGFNSTPSLNTSTGSTNAGGSLETQVLDQSQVVADESSNQSDLDDLPPPPPPPNILPPSPPPNIVPSMNE